MVLAARVRGQSDITLLTVDNGRPIADFHHSIGFFANLVPLRFNFCNCESFLDLMLLARKVNAEAYRNHLPFGAILELVPDLMGSFGDPRALPPAFTYVSSPAALADAEFVVSIEPVVLPEEVPSMFHRGGCIWSFTVLSSGEFRCVVEYEPDAADSDTIDHWGADFISLILAIADSPDRAWKNR
jgi:condensation enzyme